MSDYPKIKYPASGGGSITVDGPEHEKLLGPGWQDYPPPQPEPAKRRKKEEEPSQPLKI